MPAKKFCRRMHCIIENIRYYSSENKSRRHPVFSVGCVDITHCEYGKLWYLSGRCFCSIKKN